MLAKLCSKLVLARMAKEAYLESDFEVEEVGCRAASLYLALTVSRQELVEKG